jgi:hypothetical protein
MSNPFADPPQQSPNPFGENPYQAPYSPFPSGPRRGLINHVRIIVVLNAVQGCLELFMAGMFAFLCFVFPILVVDLVR